MPDLPNLPVSDSSSSCQLDIAHREVQRGWCLVEVTGEVDLSTSPDLHAALIELLVRRGYRRFILDLSGVGHLDSTGLGVLTEFRQRLGSGGELKLAALQPNVLNVLTLAGLDRAFEIWRGTQALPA
ncbi:MAG TPA: STAS domain-containing protein [Solirubrobacteraceae bacterium]|nr:STAS domain-containing protein [Solirubrobacteraceae bacterium]